MERWGWGDGWGKIVHPYVEKGSRGGAGGGWGSGGGGAGRNKLLVSSPTLFNSSPRDLSSY